MTLRRSLKAVLARVPDAAPARGVTVLVYHRVGGGSPHELDLRVGDFATQLDTLADHEVVSLDGALDRLDAADERPCVVLTFDDGFADVHRLAYPLLRERALPFTVYVSASFVGGTLRWEGWDPEQPAAALGWAELESLAADPSCTIGNHTWSHPGPERLGVDDIDRCSDALAERLGAPPRHFAYPFGVEVPALREELRRRFRSAATVMLGRNVATTDRMSLHRVPVRASDPPEFFRAKLAGGALRAERSYDTVVRTAKRVGLRA